MFCHLMFLRRRMELFMSVRRLSKQKELLSKELGRTSQLEFSLPFPWILESKHLK